MAWTQIWKQAMSCAFGKGKPFGKNKTICFPVKCYTSGERLRVRFYNTLGAEPYKIGAMTIIAESKVYEVTCEGKTSFEIPTGGACYSDEIVIPVKKGGIVDVRMYFTSHIADNNITEEQASLVKGNFTHKVGQVPFKKPRLVKLLGAYNGVPAIQAIEVDSKQPSKMIVAFGDSITAMSRWTKPLAERLYAEYGSEYLLLNAGISGNCLLYKVNAAFSETFGDRGVDRFERDVLETENLSTVIFALGVNDVSYYTEKTKDIINFNCFVAELTKITSILHKRGVRVVVHTITPRLGCSITLGKFTYEMEELRLKLNAWIRSCNLFDYVVDQEAVVSVNKNCGLYFDERYHQGDRLHPNDVGGQLMADIYDLAKLTGKNIH